jgi:hypothetical protein
MVQGRDRLVERGVETPDVDRFWQDGSYGLDQVERRSLVLRREASEAPQSLHGVVIERARVDITVGTVDDPVRDGHGVKRGVRG